jgi:hypothetical protein
MKPYNNPAAGRSRNYDRTELGLMDWPGLGAGRWGKVSLQAWRDQAAISGGSLELARRKVAGFSQGIGVGRLPSSISLPPELGPYHLSWLKSAQIPSDLRVVVGEPDQDADVPHALALLCARRKTLDSFAVSPPQQNLSRHQEPEPEHRALGSGMTR